MSGQPHSQSCCWDNQSPRMLAGTSPSTWTLCHLPDPLLIQVTLIPFFREYFLDNVSLDLGFHLLDPIPCTQALNPSPLKELEAKTKAMMEETQKLMHSVQESLNTDINLTAIKI